MDEKVINAIVRCLNSPASKTLSIILGLISGFWLSNLYVTHNCQKQIKKQPQNKDYFEKELKNKKNQILISWVAISFILIAPIAINFFFSLNVLYPTAPLLGNQQWLGFWGSYMGGVIGAIVTGVAFCFTYKQNEEQHAETRKIMQEEKFKDVRPYLSADQITPSELSESYRDIEIFEYSGDSIPIPALWVISANRNQLLKKIRKCMNNYYVSCVRTTNLGLESAIEVSWQFSDIKNYSPSEICKDRKFVIPRHESKDIVLITRRSYVEAKAISAGPHSPIPVDIIFTYNSLLGEELYQHITIEDIRGWSVINCSSPSPIQQLYSLSDY